MPSRAQTHADTCISRVVSSESMPQHGEFLVPSWASPAPGEAHLQPTDDTRDRQTAVDLTKEPVYSIGRSTSMNHIKLHHPTSSRRHALIFHHPCGKSYLVDLNSAHGTFVNGKCISPNVPVRIKRGSVIRFGGDGAASFILKKISSNLCCVVRELGGVAEALKSAPPNCPQVKMLENEAKQKGSARVRGDGGVSCIIVEEDVPAASLVLLNMKSQDGEEAGKTIVSGYKRKANVSTQILSRTCFTQRQRPDDFCNMSRKRLRSSFDTAENNDLRDAFIPPRSRFHIRTHGIEYQEEKKIVFVTNSGIGLTPISFSRHSFIRLNM